MVRRIRQENLSFLIWHLSVEAFILNVIFYLQLLLSKFIIYGEKKYNMTELKCVLSMFIPPKFVSFFFLASSFAVSYANANSCKSKFNDENWKYP